MANFLNSDKAISMKYSIKSIGPDLLGLPVAAIYFDAKSKVNHGWHRGIVRKILGAHEINVFYCDYGSTSDIYLPYVKFLPKRFGSPKAQAIRVRLGGIKPKKTTGSGKHWSTSAIQRFSNMVSNPLLCPPVYLVFIWASASASLCFYFFALPLLCALPLSSPTFLCSHFFVLPLLCAPVFNRSCFLVLPFFCAIVFAFPLLEGFEFEKFWNFVYSFNVTIFWVSITQIFN